MRYRLLWGCLAAFALLCSSALAASAPAPSQVRSSWLRQDVQQLVWHVQMKQPFSPTAMKRSHHTLCLVIERAANSSVSGVACVQPPARGQRSPRLQFSHVTVRGPGPGQYIDAAISRGSTRELTAKFLPSQVGIGYGPMRWQVLTTVKNQPCTAGRACKLWFPKRSVLLRMHTPRLVGCVPGGSPFVSHGPSNRKVIALTFDDGPWYDTPQFLSVLERKHVVATFFQIGEQIGTYGGAVERRMLADGDMIGDHTWSHANVTGAGSFAASQISQTAAAIRGMTGFTPCLFRAPGGAVSSALISEARSMGFTTIQWDIDPRDWSRPGTGAIYSNVVGNAHPGAIVIQHDGGGDRSETLAALPQEIDTLRARGYQFVTVTQLLGQRLIYK